MQEESIFLDALEIEDPTARAGFLDSQCGDDARLRHSIDSLIAAHERTGQFLASPVLLYPNAGATADKTNASTRIDGVTATTSPISLAFLEPATSPDSLGRLSHYEILEVLGRGGCGIVLKALDEKLQRIVAIKVIAPEFAGSETTRQRFLREARSAASIDHPNVVHTFSVEEQPIPFLVMEYVEGSTLQQKLSESGPLEIAEFVHVARQIAAGLSAAHARGLIHRDIKPGNILLDATGQHVQISDFGLARTVDDTGLTRSGEIAGTPLFMSPEQATDAPLDSKSDLFSLGSVFYAMCVGESPFQAPTTYAVLRKVVDENPPRVSKAVPSAPGWLDAMVGKLLAKNPEERTLSAEEIAEILQTFEQEIAVHGHVISSPAALQLSPPRKSWIPRWYVVITMVLLTCGLLMGISEYSGFTALSQQHLPTFGLARGELLISIVEPGIDVEIAGLDRKFNKPGEHHVSVPTGEHLLIASEQGKVTQRKRILVFANQPKKVKFTPLELDRRKLLFHENPPPLEIMGGDWSIKDGELRQSLLGESLLLFGDPQWTDFDVKFEFKTSHVIPSAGLSHLYFRAKSRDDAYRFLIIEDGHDGRTSGIEPISGGIAQYVRNSYGSNFQEDTWYPARLQVRGSHFAYTINNRTFENSPDETFSQGLIGLGTWNSPTAWRDFQVTSPDGKVLWEGFPDLSKYQDEKTRKRSRQVVSDREAAIAVIRSGGKVRVNNSSDELRDVTSLPPYPFWLTSVRVEGNSILTPGDMSHFSESRHLKTFSVSYSVDLTDKEIARLANNRELGTLNLTGTGCTGAVLTSLQNCSKLRYLSLNTPNVEDRDLETLPNFPLLGLLMLNHAAISDSSLKNISQLKWLEALGIQQTRVTDAGVASLQACPRLHSILLGGTDISDAALPELRKCASLKHLDLSGTKITDAGVKELANFPHLTFLNLDQTQVTAEGIRELSAALPGCRIDWNQTPDLKAAAYARSLGALIYLDGEKEHHPPTERIPATSFQLTGVRFLDGHSATDEELKYFAGTKNLKTIAFQNNKNISTAGLAMLSQNKDLEELSLVDVPIIAAGLAQFAECKNLHSLELVRTCIHDDEFAVIQRFPNLEHVTLGEMNINEIGFKYLAELKKLKTLCLDEVYISDESLGLLDNFPELTELRLNNLIKITNPGLLQLQDLKSLRKLYLQKNRKITAEGIEALRQALPECHIVWDGEPITPSM